ncbi:MAG: endonuclease/exonuclease/phosphatase family protein [Treponema sp.]|nr:endonuclease/exonuclease/phosphatase family protein [Treponema sp.]
MRRLLFLIILGLGLVSCSESHLSDCEKISIVSWNVQTFFDSHPDGTEYSDFVKNKKWNEEVYKLRLNRLIEIMKQLKADVYVFEEIENERVLCDLSNLMGGRSAGSSNGWKYSCFGKPEGSALGCCVFSRYELVDMKMHCLDVRIHDVVQPSMRGLLQVDIVCKKKIRLFVNHWKSKLGGEDETEIWRDWQESLLASQVRLAVSEGIDCCLICGDFNRKLDRFVEADWMTGGCLLREASFGGEKNICVFYGWSDDDLSGSYYYENSWEKIDQIFLYGKCRFEQFEVCSFWPLVNSDGLPNEFKVFSGEGYSDHLPLKAIVRVGDGFY